MSRWLRILGLLITGAVVSACAQAARTENMIPNAAAVDAASPLAGKVCVDAVTGGEETNPLWTSEVDNTAFKAAIEGAIARNGMKARSDADCRLGVAANLLGLAQPIAGFDMEVTANVNYTVTDRVSDAPYYQATVQTPFTADFSSAFLGVERLRMANEGAVRTNIERFLGQLGDHAAATPPS